MGRFQVQSPDGHVYEFEAPEGASEQQLDAMSREAAHYAKDYPVEAKQAPAPSAGKQLVDNTVNDVAGIVQGAAALPDMAATAVGKVASVVPTAVGYGLDALGYDKAGSAAHRVAHDLANPVQIGDAVESVAPTPDTTSGKANRFIGQLVGGAASLPTSAVENVVARFAGEVPKGFRSAPTQGQKVYSAAQRLGMEDKLLPADVGGTPTRMATSVSGMTLGGIPLAEQSTKGINALAAARNATADTAGAVRDATGAGQAAQAGAKNFLTTSEAKAARLYDAIPIAGERPATLSNTRNALSQLTSGLESNPELSALITDPRLKAFEAAIAGRSEQVPTGILDANGSPMSRTIQKGGQLSWQDLKAFRTYVGEKAGAPALQSDTSQKALKSLYGALSQDMAATASVEGPSALKAFTRANNFWRGRQDRIENVLNLVLGDDLNKGSMSAFEGIQRTAAAKGGDPVKLGRLMRSLSIDEADSVRASIIQRLGQARAGNQTAAGDVFSPAEFVTQWNNMDERAKIILFNKGSLRSALDDLVEVAGGMKAATKYANTSKTALSANGAILLAQLFSNPLAAVAEAGTELAIGKALSSPLLTRALVRVGRSTNPASTKAAIGRLGAIGAANANLRLTTTTLQNSLNSLNDNISAVTGAAASPGGTNPDSQQQ